MTQKNKQTLQPFNLEKALAGEPVVTRDGQEVTQLTFFDCKDCYPILAVINRNIQKFTVDGLYRVSELPNRFDLFMKSKTRTINGYEVPAPMTVAPAPNSQYFLMDLTDVDWVASDLWSGDRYDLLWLERGLVFETPGDAIANAKASLGIDPYGEMK